jgi:hypothetical protein
MPHGHLPLPVCAATSWYVLAGTTVMPTVMNAGHAGTVCMPPKLWLPQNKHEPVQGCSAALGGLLLTVPWQAGDAGCWGSGAEFTKVLQGSKHMSVPQA